MKELTTNDICKLCNDYGWKILDKILILKIRNRQFNTFFKILNELLEYVETHIDKKTQEYKELRGKLMYWHYEGRNKYNSDDERNNKEGDQSYKFKNPEYTKELQKYLNEACECGNGNAYASCAFFYYIGRVFTDKPDKKKALALFQEAQARKAILTEYLYAEALTYKNNDLNNYKTAISYYETAISKKILFARTGLARCYLKLGINLEKAKELFLKDKAGGYEAYVEEVERAINNKRNNK